MAEIILATMNRNKVREIAEIIHPIIVKSLADLKIELNLDAVEDGNTYIENAAKKVRKVAERISGIVVADDSGIEVDVLGGLPGIQSARFGGENLTDRERCELLLNKLKETPQGERQARFVCVAVALFSDGKLEAFTGTCDGIIAPAPAGKSGFGYDPVFFIPELGKTMAELPPGEKHLVSHRGIAFRKLRDYLLTKLVRF
ncbi:MAG: RdgB/HAM1 family non-canonical purine NTP pyrophosphatase [bacterium]